MKKSPKSDINKLYALREELRDNKAGHIRVFGARHDEDISAIPFGSRRKCGYCHVCSNYDAQITGVVRAIRELGGRPRC